MSNLRRPREGAAESPQEQYDKLLTEGIAVQKRFQALEERAGQLYDEGKDDEAEALSEEGEPLKDSMSYFLRQRVELIRAIEGLKTIADAFPRVKVETKEDRAQIDAADLILMFNAGKIGTEQLRAAGERMRPSAQEELTDEEKKAYAQARAELARELGYDKATPEFGWLELERNGVSFLMKQFPFPSGSGITGTSRISRMSAGNERGGMNFDNDWISACTDPEVQKEIDRAIAIFG